MGAVRLMRAGVRPMTRKMPLADYRTKLFGEYTRPPSLETLRRRCITGKLSAVQEGRQWYVLVEGNDQNQRSTGDTRADEILGIA